MLSARDAANLVPVDPTNLLRQIEEGIRTAAVAGKVSISTSLGPFGAGQGKLWDTAVSLLTQQGYSVQFMGAATIISWG